MADPEAAEAEGSDTTEVAGEETIVEEIHVADVADILAREPPPEIDASTGLPKVMKAYVVWEKPKVMVVPNFLSEKEIQHLLDLCEAHWVPSVVGSGVYKTNDESKDLRNQQSSNRTSYSCMLRSSHTSTVEVIERRLANLAGMDVDYLERLNMVRYHPGQLFNRHHDGRFRPKTVFVYLNDLPEGAEGETFFPEVNLKVVPRKGCAVMWANTISPGVEDPLTFHMGLPPKEGVKYGVNCFFNDKPLRRWEAMDSDEGDDEDPDAPPRERPKGTRYVTCDPLDFLEKHRPQGDGGGLISFVVSPDPRIAVIPNFLDETEVQTLAVVAMGQSSPDESWGHIFKRVEERMSSIVGLPRSHMDTLKVAKCTPDMLPDGHAVARADYLSRFGTKVFYCFLNDVDEGGELRFPKLCLQVKARKGTAIVWSNVDDRGEDDLRAAHQGRRPKDGVRLTMLGIFRDHPVRGSAGPQAG